MTTEGTRITPAVAPAAVASRTLVRGLTLLEIVASTPGGIGVTDIADAAELDKGTASRLLATLRQLGYVQQRGVDRRYVLGSRCLWLASEYQASQEDLTAVAKPHLIALRDLTSETVHLAVREGLYMVYVAQEEPDRSVRVSSAVGARVPMHRTAMGRAILAKLSEADREQTLSQIREEVEAAGGEVDFDEIRGDIVDARIRGWAAVDRHDDVTRIAAAILDRNGDPVAAIALSGPSYRLDDEVERMGNEVVATAHAVGDVLNL